MKYIFSLCFSLWFFGSVYCQTQDPFQHAANMLPPSPTASELGKYGLLPVGLATGSANVDIPIHTFSAKDLSVPISLSYSSNGIKVDQIASWVGLSWSLNAGGVITRIIRDEADDPNPVPYPENFDPNNPAALKYLEYCADDHFDSEPDLYTFNFDGHVGKFLYDRSGGLVILPYLNIKIERVIDSTPTGGYFRITLANGVKYLFESVELSRTFAIGSECGKNYDGRQETAWYLTQVQHPTGEIIHLEYDGFRSYTYPLGVSQTIMKNIGEVNCSSTSPSCPAFNYKTCQNALSVTGGYLRRIYSPDFGEVEFIAALGREDLADYKLNEIRIKDKNGLLIKSFSFQYTFSQATSFTNDFSIDQTLKRMFLTKLAERDRLGNELKTHSFEYEDINGLPPRLSFAQDHWGYFNGAGNEYFVPKDEQGIEDNLGRKVFEGIGGNREANSSFSKKGLLKKITYPTGGYSELQYEPNTYYGTQVVEPVKTPIYLTATGTEFYSPLVSKFFTFYNVRSQEILIRTSASLDPGYAESDIDPIHNKGIVSVFDITSGSYVLVPRQFQIGESFLSYVDLFKDHEYKITLSAGGDIVDASLISDYYAETSQTIETNIETGGVRIAKIKNYDAVTGGTEDKDFSYSSVSTPTRSSGNTNSMPIYMLPSTISVACALICDYKNCLYQTLYSSSQNTLYPVNGNNIYYQYVTVSRGSNNAYGVEEHEFLIQFDLPGNIVWGGENIMQVPHTNFGWSNGLEKSTRYYKFNGKSLTMIKLTANNYVTDQRNEKEVKALVVRKKYQPTCTRQAVVTCDANSINRVYTVYTCVTNHNHIWLLFGSGQCIASGRKNQSVIVGYDPCYGKSEGQIITIPYALDHLNAVEYSNKSYWFYLESTVETQYDEQGSNPVTTTKQYFYDNPVHGQLSRIQNTRSDDKLMVSSMKYPEDYAGIENFGALLDNHIIGVPIKIENSVGGNLVEGKIFKYNDKGQPLEAYQYESATLQAPPVHDPQVFIPSQEFKLKTSLTYDAGSNLSEVNSTAAPKLIYKYGFNGSRIIAKVVGADAERVFYTSFEEDGITGEAKTGVSFLNAGSYSVPVSFNPASTTDLVMSYWYWANNAWVFSGELPFSRTISQGSKLDELRVYPQGSQMTTITYDVHSNLIKTVTDTNSVTSYYEYDDLGRLLQVRDDSGNILTEYKYHYYNND